MVRIWQSSFCHTSIYFTVDSAMLTGTFQLKGTCEMPKQEVLETVCQSIHSDKALV